MAVGVDGDGGDIAGGCREELLALEFVPGAEEVGRAERRIEAGLQHVGPAVEEAAVLVERLESDAKRTVYMLPLRSHRLVGDAVGGAGGDGVPQHRAAVEERRSPDGIRVVGAGDESCRAAVYRQSLLESLQLVRRQRDGSHDARGRKVGEHLGRELRTVAGLRFVVAVPDAPGRRERGAELVAQHALRRDAAIRIRAANAVRHVDVGQGAAVGQPVARQSAAHARQGAEHAESAAFGKEVAVCRAASGAGGDVDHPRHCIRAVQRRAGPAHHLDLLGVDGRQIREKSGCVALRAGGVPEAHAVDQHGRIVAPQAAGLDGGQAARSTERLHADAGQRP